MADNPDLIIHQDGSVTLSRRRHSMALEAAYQIESLAPVIEHVAKHAGDENMEFQNYLHIRYLCQRIQVLVCSQMDALHDELVQTDEIAQDVFLGLDERN